MVINKKVMIISLAAFVAQPALGFGMKAGRGMQNVASYMAKKNVKMAIKETTSLNNNLKPVVTSTLKVTPVQAVKAITKSAPNLNLAEFNPLAAQTTLAAKAKSLEFTAKNALEQCQNKYAALYADFAEVASAICNPSNIVEFMAKTGANKAQAALEVARTTKEFLTVTATKINAINRQLAQDLQAAGVGEKAGEYAAMLKADAQAAIETVQAIAGKTIANLQATYAKIATKGSEWTKIAIPQPGESYIYSEELFRGDPNYGQLFSCDLNSKLYEYGRNIDFLTWPHASPTILKGANGYHALAKACIDASKNPKATAHGLFAATILAGTAGYMGYEANQQSNERKNRKTTDLVSQEETPVSVVVTPLVKAPVIVEAPVVVTPVIDFEVEEAKRKLAEADLIWEGLKGAEILEKTDSKPVLAFKNGELAVGPVGLSANNFVKSAKSIKDFAYTNAQSLGSSVQNLGSKMKTGLTNYFGKWFGANQ